MIEIVSFVVWISCIGLESECSPKIITFAEERNCEVLYSDVAFVGRCENGYCGMAQGMEAELQCDILQSLEWIKEITDETE